MRKSFFGFRHAGAMVILGSVTYEKPPQSMANWWFGILRGTPK